MRKIFVILILNILLTGCVTDFNFEFDKLEPRLVVDAVITNQSGPYYIRLSESNVGGSLQTASFFSIDNAVGVKNALVVLSDNYGQIDTLLPVGFDPEREFITPERGYYKTNTIEGIAGRTYFLKIVSDGKTYTANCYMPEVPEIDSLSYTVEKGEIGKFDRYIPLLYFKNPQHADNYYLINHTQAKTDIVDLGYVLSSIWQYSILSDKFLEPYVDGLYVENGAAHEDAGHYYYFPEDVIRVRLQSITQEAYYYYKILLKQFENDGGTYKPTPTSPPTNISNGALGFFRASAVSEKVKEIPEITLESN